MFGLTPFPTSEQSLSYFLAFLFQEGLSASSVKGYLSAVRHVQIALGLGDLKLGEMPQLEYSIKGLRRLYPGQCRARLPIMLDILCKLRKSWEATERHYDGAMLWAASCMCFFGFLRIGEIAVPSDLGFNSMAHLALGDVQVDSTTDPRYLQVHIKASKTDPFRQGVFIYLGRTNADVCLVAAILAYMVLWGPEVGPFFRFADGRCLTRNRSVAAVCAALHPSFIDAEKYSRHSFCIGAATTAA